MLQGTLRAWVLIRRWVKQGFLEEVMLAQIFKMRKEGCREGVKPSTVNPNDNCPGAQGAPELVWQRVGDRYRRRGWHSSSATIPTLSP